MSLFLYKSNRLERLVSRLSTQVLNEPLSSPFVPEQIVVGSQGMAQWLKLELSRKRGIVANVELPFPRAFISALVQKVVSAEARSGAIEPEALAWRIFGKLDNLLPETAFADIRNYLASSDDPRRKFQLAQRAASLLDEYSVYRPKFIECWIQGQESHWQAALWRAVMTEGLACQGKFLYELIRALKNPSCDRSGLPERLSVFAPGSLPPSYLHVFEALACHIPVHLFCLAPSQEYWGDTVSALEAERIQSRASIANVDVEGLHLDCPNPLLGAWGATGRAFQRMVTDLEGIVGDLDDFDNPGRQNLLTSIQSSILLLEEDPEPAARGEIRRDDRSVQLHNCHSPLRELQVLRDQMLDWFSTDPTLSPQDVLVILTDVEAYAPYIKGVFDNAEPGAPPIPYTLADRGARQESALIDGFIALLRLHSARLTSTDVLDFSGTAAVRRRFGIAEEELEQIRLWIQNAAIRWGRDAEHRVKLGLPRFGEHSWAYGRSRLLLGYAMADGEDVLVHELLPCQDIEGTTTALLGRWLDFLQQLFAALDELSKPRDLVGWARALNHLLDTLFLPDAEEERAANSVRQVLDGLRQQQQVSGFTHEVPLAVVLEHILPKLEEDQPGKAFLRGAVTFGGLNPMRGIPFRVVCLLGMQDGSFPRNPAPPSFDLMAQHPQSGDESRREDDRFLFLQSLLAARDRFYLSYVGQSVRDNSPRPPSVVLSELLDFVSSRFRLEGAAEDKPGEEPRIVKELLLTVHRLHAFSPAYFLNQHGDERLFGYSPSFAKVSRVLADPFKRTSPEGFLPQPLQALGSEWLTVSLRDLQSFFRNPSQFFIQKRLEFRLPEDHDLLLDEEPFSLDALASYHCKQEVIDSLFTGRSRSALMTTWKASGELPPGPAGKLVGNGLFAAAEPIRRELQERLNGSELAREPFVLKLSDFTLQGELAHFPGVGIVHYRAAKVDRKKKAEAHLKLWIEHLVLQLAIPAAAKTSCLIGDDKTYIFNPVPDADQVLLSLLRLYLRGLGAPLPFFPKSAFAYVIGPGKAGKSTPDELASNAWEGDEDNDFREGEKEDPYFNLCFGNDPDPLGTDFRQIAAEVVGPLLTHQREDKEA